jgi:hypothetical protein
VNSGVPVKRLRGPVAAPSVNWIDEPMASVMLWIAAGLLGKARSWAIFVAFRRAASPLADAGQVVASHHPAGATRRMACGV